MADVMNNWGYFRPIVQGIVRFTGAEFDAMPPALVRKINAAIDIKDQSDKNLAETIKRKAGLQDG